MRDKVRGGVTLAELLPDAQRGGYAVPAFSARYLACVRPVVEAAVAERSPFVVEISQRELAWFDLTPEAFRDEVQRVVTDLRVDLHSACTSTTPGPPSSSPRQWTRASRRS